MKIKRLLKILLLVCCFVLTSISIVLMYTVLIVENSSFEYSMLIPLSMIPNGVLSVIYHIKTLKNYCLNFVYKDLKDAVLWIGNLLFAISIFTMAFFMLYAIYGLNEVELSSEFIYILIFCGIILLLGVTLILEEKILYRKYVLFKEQSRINTIEDISGHKDDNV